MVYPARRRVSVEGVVLLDEASKLKILHTAEAPVPMNVKQHDMTFTCEIPVLVDFCNEESEEVSRLHTSSRSGKLSPSLSPWPGAQRMLNTGNQGTDFRRKEGIDLQMVPEEVEDVSWKKYRMDVKKSLSLNLEREPDIESDNKNGHAIVTVLECSWSYEDEALAWTIMDILRRSRLKMN
ncbi:unnamed protein product [Calypogeia fissa]